MITNDFTQVYTGEDMTVGYIPGSSKVLFIKTGQGGTIYGYDNKYLDLAIKIHKQYGWSVSVSATIVDIRESFERDIRIVEEALGTSEFEIYYLGVSKGGLIGIWYGADEPRVAKMVSVNAPLMINFHGKTLPGIKKLGKEKLFMVYGSLDPSYKYVPFVEKHTNVEIIEGADHNLRGTEIDFISLIEQLLLEVPRQATYLI